MFKYLLMHALLSGLVSLYGTKKNSNIEKLCYFILAFMCPFGGCLLVLVLRFYSTKIVLNIEDDEEYDHPIVLFTDRINIERDMNIIALEDALLSTDISTKRKQLLRVLKQDISRYANKLNIALKDPDVETSHYAASAVFELKRKLDIKMISLVAEMEIDPGDHNLVVSYLEVIDEYVRTEMLDEYSKKKLVTEYLKYGELLIEGGGVNPNLLKKLIDYSLEAGDKKLAREYGDMFLKTYESEDAYVGNLKLYYSLRDHKGFSKIYNQLLKSDVKLSREGLKIVRFWLEEYQ